MLKHIQVVVHASFCNNMQVIFRSLALHYNGVRANDAPTGVCHSHGLLLFTVQQGLLQTGRGGR